MFIAIMVWVLIGMIAGLVVSLVFPDSKKYIVGTVSFGIIGSIVGGLIYSAFRVSSAAYSLGPNSIVMTIIFAIIFTFALRIVVRS